MSLVAASVVVFFKQKTAYEMRISDWSSDVCSSDLVATVVTRDGAVETWPAARLGYTYRHSALPAGAVVVEALFAGVPGDKAGIAAELDRLAAEREADRKSVE